MIAHSPDLVLCERCSVFCESRGAAGATHDLYRCPTCGRHRLVRWQPPRGRVAGRKSSYDCNAAVGLVWFAR